VVNCNWEVKKHKRNTLSRSDSKFENEYAYPLGTRQRRGTRRNAWPFPALLPLSEGTGEACGRQFLVPVAHECTPAMSGVWSRFASRGPTAAAAREAAEEQAARQQQTSDCRAVKMKMSQKKSCPIPALLAPRSQQRPRRPPHWPGVSWMRERKRVSEIVSEGSGEDQEKESQTAVPGATDVAPGKQKAEIPHWQGLCLDLCSGSSCVREVWMPSISV
jgi:hypothetical protein